MSFKDYYQGKKISPIKLRDDVCALLEISVKTFYNRMNNDSWTRLEKIAIAKHIGYSEQQIDELFPETIEA